MKERRRNRLVVTATAWCVALGLSFPLLWMLLTSFKTELAAISKPTLFFEATLENYRVVHQRADYLKAATNSFVISVGATALAILVGGAGAYAMAFFPTRRTRATLLWMLSTKMMPPVGALVPVYLIFRDLQLLDTLLGLTVVCALLNLPIAVWMLYTFFREVPREVLEAARVDGASPVVELRQLVLPLCLPGIASTALLSIILCWNEAFWSLNLTTSQAAPLTQFMATFSAPEGLFWAKLSAASTMAVAPILLFGWMTQRHLVRGLTFGAIK